jgi:hypothetical protein
MPATIQRKNHPYGIVYDLRGSDMHLFIEQRLQAFFTHGRKFFFERDAVRFDCGLRKFQIFREGEESIEHKVRRIDQQVTHDSS